MLAADIGAYRTTQQGGNGVGDQPEARANVETRVGDLERWQGIVDYRLGEGEKRFTAINERLIEQAERQNELEKHILSGNRDTADLKRSWEQWLTDWRSKEQTKRINRPRWWQVILTGIAAVIALGSVVISIIMLTHGGGKS